MEAKSWRVLIPVRQCWQPSKDQPVSVLSCYFVAILRVWDHPWWPFLRHSREVLACSSWWVRTGTWQGDPLGSSCFRSREQLRSCAFRNQHLFGYSEKHLQGSLRLYGGRGSAPSEGGAFDCYCEENHIEGNPLLSAFGALQRRPWQWGLWCVYRRFYWGSQQWTDLEWTIPWFPYLEKENLFCKVLMGKRNEIMNINLYCRAWHIVGI